MPENYWVASARRYVLFVNPSRAKGGARVLAMASALPQISFHIREGWGHEDIVIRDFGAAVDGPLADWRAALAQMSDDRAYCDRLMAAGQAAAIGPTRAPEKVLDQWEALFHAVEA